MTTTNTQLQPPSTPARPAPTRAGTLTTAAALIAAPLLLTAAELLSPIDDSGDTPAERLDDILNHTGRYSLTITCLIAGLFLLVPAIFTVRNHAVPGRRAATVGATLAAAGFMLFSVATGALGVAPSAWADLPDTDKPALVRAFTAMDVDANGAMPLVQGGPLLAILGLTILAITLWRHSTHPRWATIALPLGWALFLLTPTHPSRIAAALILLAALAPTAAALPPPARPGPNA